MIPQLYTVLSLIIFTWAKERMFEILHDGDILGRMGPVSGLDARICYENATGCVGGAARLISKVKELKANQTEDRVVLYLSTGSICGGTVLFSGRTKKERIELCTDFLSALEPDAISISDVEFLAAGVEVLSEMSMKTKIPFLTSMKIPGDMGSINDFTVIRRETFNFAIIGYLYYYKRLEVQQLYEIYIPQLEAYLNQLIPEIIKYDVDFIIALGTSSFDYDLSVAREVSGVDIIVSGGSERFQANHVSPDGRKPDFSYPYMVTHLSGRNIYVAHTGGMTKYLGHLKCTLDMYGGIDKCTGDQIYLDESIPEDPKMKDLYNKAYEAVKPLQSDILGSSGTRLEGLDECKVGECSFGNLVTDAFVSYAASIYIDPDGEKWTNVSIGILSASFILTDLLKSKQGEISKFHLMDAYTSGGNLTVLYLTGRDLLQCLEVGLRGTKEMNRKEFLQVSGLNVVFDSSAPLGKRVKSLKVRCWNCTVTMYLDIQADEKYPVVTNYDLSRGNAGHTVLRQSILLRYQLTIDDISCISWYLDKKRMYVGLEGRIINNTRTSETKVNQGCLVTSSFLFAVCSCVFVLTIAYFKF